MVVATREECIELAKVLATEMVYVNLREHLTEARNIQNKHFETALGNHDWLCHNKGLVLMVASLFFFQRVNTSYDFKEYKARRDIVENQYKAYPVKLKVVEKAFEEANNMTDMWFNARYGSDVYSALRFNPDFRHEFRQQVFNNLTIY